MCDKSTKLLNMLYSASHEKVMAKNLLDNVAELLHVTFSEWQYLCMFHPYLCLNITTYLKSITFYDIYFVFQMWNNIFMFFK